MSITETTLPATIAAEYESGHRQMEQACTDLHIHVCRICGTACKLVRVGPDVRPSRGCILTAEYAEEGANCRGCNMVRGDGVDTDSDTLAEVRRDVVEWGRQVARFQASIAEARVAEVEERLATLEARLAGVMPRG